MKRFRAFRVLRAWGIKGLGVGFRDFPDWDTQGFSSDTVGSPSCLCEGRKGFRVEELKLSYYNECTILITTYARSGNLD